MRTEACMGGPLAGPTEKDHPDQRDLVLPYEDITNGINRLTVYTNEEPHLLSLQHW